MRDSANYSEQPSSKDRKAMNNHSYKNRSNLLLSNPYDTFQEKLDDFLSDPEDEQTYPPEIFDDQMDETEEEYDRPDFEY